MRLLALILIFGLGSLHGSEQHFRLTKEPLRMSTDRLVIRLPSLSQIGTWSLAVRSVTGKPPFAVIASLAPDTPPADWPRNLVLTDDGTLTIYGQPSPLDLLVYAELPAGVEVVASADGKTIVSERLTSSLSFKNGVATGRSIHGLFDALVSQRATLSAAGPADIFKKRNGSIGVNLNNVLNHVTDLKLADIPAANASCSCARRALFRIKISENGTVSSVSAITGSGDLTALGVQLLKLWRFRPFEYGGTIVPVEALVPLIADAAGHVHVPGR